MAGSGRRRATAGLFEGLPILTDPSVPPEEFRLYSSSPLASTNGWATYRELLAFLSKISRRQQEERAALEKDGPDPFADPIRWIT